MRPRSAICGLAASTLTVLAISGATSLQAEYRPRAASEEIALARDTCTNVMRIKPGFVPFDACVESLAQTLKGNSSGPRKAAASYAISPPKQTSYSESNPAERRRKEEYACTQLGIAPGMAGFGQCVAQLDSALRSTEHSD
jgi:hypothetical protein